MTYSDQPGDAVGDALLAHLVEDRLVVIAGAGGPASDTHLRRLGARDVLRLVSRPDGPGEARFTSSARVGANNCTVAILGNRAAFALRSRKFFRSFETLLIPLDWSTLSGSIGLARYLARGRFVPHGRVRLEGVAMPLAAFRNTFHADRPRHRIYADHAMSPLAILQAIADLDAVALRWVEDVETGVQTSDLDLLVRASAAEELESRLTRKAGTFPVDLYTDDGSGKRLFKAVPYYPPHIADRILASAVPRESGVRVPSPPWRYVAFAFHLLFHKSDRLAAGTEALAPGAFGDEKYVRELWRLADEAGEPHPRTIAGIENLLACHDAFPEFDTIGFYSERNAFLTARYAQRHKDLAPGLGVFVLRDFGLQGEVVAEVRSRLSARGFEILAETAIARGHDAVVRIRGGNWIDDSAPGKFAPPVHAFACLDRDPIAPSRLERRRYPRLDNARMLLKAELRTDYAGHGGKQKLNMIHASDNSVEARFYAEVVGLAHLPAVAAAIARL